MPKSPETGPQLKKIPDKKVNPEKIGRHKKVRRSQEMANIVLEHPEFKYKDIQAQTTKGVGEKFDKKTREIWSQIEIVIHGMEKWVDGKQELKKRGDLDGKGFLGLLRLAGLKPKKIEYISKGAAVPGKMHIDTGGRYGIVLEKEKDGKTTTIYFDHHSAELEIPTSATQLLYEGLTASGILKKDVHLNELVRFVTQADNLSYPEEYYKLYSESPRTLVGLWYHIKFRHLLDFFIDNKKPTDILTDAELKKYHLEKTSKNKLEKNNVAKSLAILKEMEQTGLIIETEKYGKIAVDLDKRIPDGTIAAKYYGCNGYIIWESNEVGFFVTVPGRDIAENFSQGVKVRGSMWIKNPYSDPSPRKITLTEILTKLTSGKLNPTGKLKEYLDEEAKTISTQELSTKKDPGYNVTNMTEVKKLPETPKSKSVADLLDRLGAKNNDNLDSKKITSAKFDEQLEFLDQAEELNYIDPIKAIELLADNDLISPSESDEFLRQIRIELGENPPASITKDIEPTSSPDIDSNKEKEIAKAKAEIDKINRQLHEDVIQGWDKVQAMQKRRAELVEEIKSLGGDIPKKEITEEEIDRHIEEARNAARGTNRGLGGETPYHSIMPSDTTPDGQEIGGGEDYWLGVKEDLKNKKRTVGEEAKKKKIQEKLEVEGKKRKEEIEKIKARIREINYILKQKYAYLNDEVAKKLAQAKDIARAPSISSEELAYWKHEYDTTEKEIEPLKKELEKLNKKLPPEEISATQAQFAAPEVPQSPRPEVMPIPNISAEPEPLVVSPAEPKHVGSEWGNWFKDKYKKLKESTRDKVDMARVRQSQIMDWFKERAKSMWGTPGTKTKYIPIFGETAQAEILRRGTNVAARNAEEMAQQIKNEIDPNLNIDQAHEIANEITETRDQLRKVTGHEEYDFTSTELSEAVGNILLFRKKKNDLLIEDIIKRVTDTLKERISKVRGQATSRAVLTEGAMAEIEDQLRTKLKDIRNGQIGFDAKNFGKLMRETLDIKYWARYGYDLLKILAIGGLIHYYFQPGQQDTEQAIVSGDGFDINLPPEASETLDSKMEWMDKNLWITSKKLLADAGAVNPTNKQIQIVDTILSIANNVKVIDPTTGNVIWVETINGEILDRVMQPGFVDVTEAFKVAQEIAFGTLKL